jgi:D-sedoheptulose 7-phosphate isomerase|tara:strand:+ start:2289 stop:2864 length:576 start_codon:yes stop_codon:yes gene_type:complete
MKNKNEIIKKEFNEIIGILNHYELSKNTSFTKLCDLTIAAFKKKKKIIFFGNGGSAADAQHLATEFVVKYSKKRSALPAISLATDTSILTAIGNDFAFKNIFSRQIEAIGEKGDIAIAITTSGNSINLIEAIKTANKKKITTFCFSGNLGGKLKKYVKYPIIIPSKKTSAIQVIEIMIGQIFCEIVEKKFL